MRGGTLTCRCAPPQGGHGRLGVALELRADRVAELNDERLRDVVAHLRAVALARDEARAVQDAELLRDVRLLGTEPLDEVRHAERPFAELLDHSQSRRLAEDREDGRDLGENGVRQRGRAP